MKLYVKPKELEVDVEADLEEVEALWNMLTRSRPKQDTRPVGWFEQQSMRRSKPRM